MNQGEHAKLTFKDVKTPIGLMTFGSTKDGLCLMDFTNRNSFPSIIKRIKKYYDHDKMVKNYIKVYDKAIKKWQESVLS